MPAGTEGGNNDKERTGRFPFTPALHTNETAVCPHCGKGTDVVVQRDAGTGTVTVPELKDQRAVTAQGITI